MSNMPFVAGDRLRTTGAESKCCSPTAPRSTSTSSVLELAAERSFAWPLGGALMIAGARARRAAVSYQIDTPAGIGHGRARRIPCRRDRAPRATNR